MYCYGQLHCVPQFYCLLCCPDTHCNGLRSGLRGENVKVRDTLEAENKEQRIFCAFWDTPPVSQFSNKAGTSVSARRIITIITESLCVLCTWAFHSAALCYIYIYIMSSLLIVLFRTNSVLFPRLQSSLFVLSVIRHFLPDGLVFSELVAPLLKAGNRTVSLQSISFLFPL